MLFRSLLLLLLLLPLSQSCPTLCDPIDGSPPGSAVPGTLQARTLESIYHHSLVIAQFLVKPRISVSNYINADDSMSE